MDHRLADAAIRTADADVFIRAAKAALGVAFEVGEDKHRIVVEDVFSHLHLGEPLAALDRQRRSSVRVHDVHRTEGPAVDLQGLPVLLGGVAAALIVGVGLHNGRTRQVLFNQLLDPRARDNVWSVRFAGVQLDGNLAGHIAADPAEDFAQALCRKISGKVNCRLFSRALLVRNVMVAACSWNWFLIGHTVFPLTLDAASGISFAA